MKITGINNMCAYILQTERRHLFSVYRVHVNPFSARFKIITFATLPNYITS